MNLKFDLLEKMNDNRKQITFKNMLFELPKGKTTMQFDMLLNFTQRYHDLHS